MNRIELTETAVRILSGEVDLVNLTYEQVKKIAEDIAAGILKEEEGKLSYILNLKKAEELEAKADMKIAAGKIGSAFRLLVEAQDLRMESNGRST